LCNTDVYFDGQTWDFKISSFKNEDSLRQTIKEGRKADCIILIVNTRADFQMIEKAIKSEIGRRINDGSWLELPNVYGWFQGHLEEVWNKKRQGPAFNRAGRALSFWVSSYVAKIQRFFDSATFSVKKTSLRGAECNEVTKQPEGSPLRTARADGLIMSA